MGLMRAIESSQQIIQYAGRSIGDVNNGWSMMYEGGRYGNDYSSRASINMRAAGLNALQQHSTQIDTRIERRAAFGRQSSSNDHAS
ncbi:hypothetical protein O9992_24225 [Vibrio lentus]|nr:hypothetical protein [Vibrio lentus]